MEEAEAMYIESFNSMIKLYTIKIDYASPTLAEDKDENKYLLAQRILRIYLFSFRSL